MAEGVFKPGDERDTANRVDEEFRKGTFGKTKPISGSLPDVIKPEISPVKNQRELRRKLSRAYNDTVETLNTFTSLEDKSNEFTVLGMPGKFIAEPDLDPAEGNLLIIWERAVEERVEGIPDPIQHTIKEEFTFFANGNADHTIQKDKGTTIFTAEYEKCAQACLDFSRRLINAIENPRYSPEELMRIVNKKLYPQIVEGLKESGLTQDRNAPPFVKERIGHKISKLFKGKHNKKEINIPGFGNCEVQYVMIGSGDDSIKAEGIYIELFDIKRGDKNDHILIRKDGEIVSPYGSLNSFGSRKYQEAFKKAAQLSNALKTQSITEPAQQDPQSW